MKTGEGSNIPSGWYAEMIVLLQEKKIKSNLYIKARLHHKNISQNNNHLHLS